VSRPRPCDAAVRRFGMEQGNACGSGTLSMIGSCLAQGSGATSASLSKDWQSLTRL